MIKSKQHINQKKVLSFDFVISSLLSEEFISKTWKYDEENKRNGLTHIVIDDYTKEEYLKDIVNNESKYNYLERIELDLMNNKQGLIVYKINFEEFVKIKDLE